MAEFVELTIDQGATFNTVITVNDGTGVGQNLVGYVARSQMRKSYYSSSKNSFNVTVSTPNIGEITMAMTAANTANLTPGRYVYDIVTSDEYEVKNRIIEGMVLLREGVTR